MALTVSQIMQISWPLVRTVMHANDYELQGPVEPPNFRGYAAYLWSRSQNVMIPIKWTYEEELKQDTEAKKIDFVRALLENAVCALDFVLEKPVDAVDVSWD